ncbi:hypothetical protein Tsp_05785 [Trichinella spiralis]|uniref:hypothetical protein n=1 Tax=Trichinella spiralis TaxID=6334 RepID=UPI0001EFBFD5|nr:hypothetical protein Tsp_05785 [Trichinella spiralis]
MNSLLFSSTASGKRLSNNENNLAATICQTENASEFDEQANEACFQEICLLDFSITDITNIFQALLGFVTLKNMLLERALNSFTRISISESLVSDYTLCNYVETTTTISQLEAKWNFFQSALMSETLCDVQLMRILTSLYFLGYTVTFSQTATLYNPAKKPIVIDDDCLQR